MSEREASEFGKPPIVRLLALSIGACPYENQELAVCRISELAGAQR